MNQQYVYKYQLKFQLSIHVENLKKSQYYLNSINYLMPKLYNEDLKDEKLATNHTFSFKWVLNNDHYTGYVQILTTKKLTKPELEIAKDNIDGQNSDGLGETFEQQEFTNYASIIAHDELPTLIDKEPLNNYINDPAYTQTQMHFANNINMINHSKTKSIEYINKKSQEVMQGTTLNNAQSDLKKQLGKIRNKYHLTLHGFQLVMNQIIDSETNAAKIHDRHYNEEYNEITHKD